MKFKLNNLDKQDVNILFTNRKMWKNKRRRIHNTLCFSTWLKTTRRIYLYPRGRCQKMDLSGFAVFDFSEGIPYFSVTSNGVTFNPGVCATSYQRVDPASCIAGLWRKYPKGGCFLQAKDKWRPFCALERTRFGGNFQTPYGIRFTAWISCERWIGRKWFNGFRLEHR